MIPDPLKDWYANARDQKDLEIALNLPIIQKAMAVLQRIALPKSDFSDRGSAETITHAAQEQNRTAGFFSYPDHLWQLTEPLISPPKTPAGYSDSYCIAWAKAHGMWEEDPKVGAEQEERQP